VGETTSIKKPKRWYDPYKVTMILFSIVGLFITAWGGFVFTMAYGATTANARQDEQIKSIVDKIDGIDKKQDRIDGKVDRVLERLPK
jgi:preprotein translocase subunit SecY